MPSQNRRTAAQARAILCLLGLVFVTERLIVAEDAPAKYALLIGCSDYQHLPGKNLRGPKNDVKEFAKTLITRFGFAPANIRQLIGGSDKENAANYPTRNNILKELDQLAERSADGVQIVVAFSGHGTRIPIPEKQNPLDPKNPEPDGFDEAFVAADAQLVDGEMQNLILDDELGVRLQRLRAGGAQVWALFDCCHSGTMSRGGDDDEASGEVSRELTAVALGVPAAKVVQAEAKAAEVKAQAGESNDAVNIFDEPSAENARGSFVAFYAAQPFETAPDLPCPPNAPKTDGHYFGLLTYSTLQTLLRERPAGRMTYRELGQSIIGRYRAERGTRGPTPNFSGDLDREVLGLKTWPGRSQMLLQKSGTTWAINAGELQGLSTGAVLALYPPATVAKEGESPVGYVRVKSATPTTADVEPCAHEKAPALAASKLQEAMRCEIVSRQLGDLRLKLHVPEGPELQAAAKFVADYVQVVDDPAADWHLLAVTPAEAKRDYALTIASPRVLLIRKGESALAASAPLTAEAKPAGRVWQQYDPSDVAPFRTALTADFHKAFTWQNLWRVAGGLGKELADTNCDVNVELAALTGADDATGGKLLTNAAVANGDYLELRVTNNGVDRVWVTLVFLDADFRVVVLPTQQLNRPGNAGDALKPIRFQIAAKTPGPQSWLVIASSAEADRLEPDLKFLAQSGLGRAPKPVLAAERAGGSPFEMLALAVAGQQGAFRGTVTPSAKNPTLLLRSWIAAPATAKP